jgi:hypothetical protein
MKVTFDSNVWQPVVEPKNYYSDPDAASFAKINTAIINKHITPFISETIFTLEGIRRNDRKTWLGKYAANVVSTESTSGDSIKVSVSISSNAEVHPGNNAYLAKYLNAAHSLGFEIIDLPRLGGISNPDVESLLVNQTPFEFDTYMTRASEIADFIERLGCGMKPLYQVLLPYPRPYGSSMYQWIASVPEAETKRIAKAVAEWADSDSITAHIAMNNDYFCTRDQARGAGQSSILGDNNKAALIQQYGFKTVTPAELAQML